MRESVSCFYRCDHRDKHTCQCDAECEVFGDCCADFKIYCQVNTTLDAIVTASRMSYWFRRRERYHRPASNVCPSRWMVSPPKHVLRGWPTCYDGGTDTCAGRTPLGWRYTCLLVGHTTTAVLIHTSAGRTPLGWRYTYTCLLSGHTCYDGDTSAGRTTHTYYGVAV